VEATGSAAQPAETLTFVWSAPALALGIMVMVAAAVWWLRSTLGKSQVKDLKAQISIALETAQKLEQRLSIAREQEQAIVSFRHQLEAQITKLQRQVLFSPERVRASTKVLAGIVTRMKAAQCALADTLDDVSAEEEQGHHPTDTDVSAAGAPT
jgi:hypothetical protein